MIEGGGICMKLFIKFLIAALVLAVLLPFTVLKGKDGRPLMSFSNLKAPDLALPKIPDSDDLSSLSKAGKRTDVIYQWRDANGDLHFTSERPPEGVEYTAKGYDPDTNLIQSVEVKHEEPEAVAVQQPAISTPSDIGNPYSPEKIEKLFKDAQNVQKLMNDRYQQQESILNNLDHN
jgi:hypothetical protein